MKEADLCRTFSRREFGWAVLTASAVASLPNRAHADIPVDELRLPVRCKNAIRLIGPSPQFDSSLAGISLNRLLFTPLRDNIPWFLTNTASYIVEQKPHTRYNEKHSSRASTVRVRKSNPLRVALVNLNSRLDYLFNADSPEGRWSLADFYVNSTKDWDKQLLANIEQLANHIHSPWLVLRNHERRAVRKYLNDPILSELLGDIEIQGIWTRSREDLLEYDVNPVRWQIMREGFTIGVWTELRRPTSVEAESFDKVVGNGQCWSESSDSCVDSEDVRDYCDTDNDGGPTSSSDSCT